MSDGPACLCGHPEAEHYPKGGKEPCYHCPCEDYLSAWAARFMAELAEGWE